MISMEIFKYKIKEITNNLFYGTMPKVEDIAYDGYPILSGYRIVGFSKKYNINEDTLIVVARGVGGTGDVKIAPAFSFLTNLSIALKLNDDMIDLKFAYYYLNKQGLRYLDTGAAQSQITISNLANHYVYIPDIITQKKVARILDNYDQLIENNNKRIEILEKMAESLYKEWFCRFRFPNHENVKFENGIPYDWEYKKFSDICPFVRGISYSSDQIDIDNASNYLVNLKNLRDYGGFRKDNYKTYEGKYKKEQIVKKFDLVLAVTEMVQERRIIGYVGLVPSYDKNCVISSDLIKIVSEIDNIFLYSMFTYGGASLCFSQYGNGTNVIHLKPTSLRDIKLLIPTKKLIDKYVCIAKDFFEKIDKLQLENENLIKQRDLLLPRLMSGKLSVEGKEVI